MFPLLPSVRRLRASSPESVSLPLGFRSCDDRVEADGGDWPNDLRNNRQQRTVLALVGTAGGDTQAVIALQDFATAPGHLFGAYPNRFGRQPLGLRRVPDGGVRDGVRLIRRLAVPDNTNLEHDPTLTAKAAGTTERVDGRYR